MFDAEQTKGSAGASMVDRVERSGGVLQNGRSPRLNGDCKPAERQHNSAPDVASEDGAHELLHAPPAAVYTTDAAGYITFYNEAAAALWGCRPKLNTDQWCGSWRMYWPDGTPLPHDRCPMAVAVKEGRSFAGNGQEAIAERPDGTRVPFMAWPSALRDSTGAVVGALNMFVDISERKRAETALRENEERFRALVEASSQIVWTTDADGLVIEDSPSWRAFTGQTFDEWKGYGWTNALHPEDRDRVIEMWAARFQRARQSILNIGFATSAETTAGCRFAPSPCGMGTAACAVG